MKIKKAIKFFFAAAVVVIPFCENSEAMNNREIKQTNVTPALLTVFNSKNEPNVTRELYYYIKGIRGHELIYVDQKGIDCLVYQLMLYKSSGKYQIKLPNCSEKIELNRLERKKLLNAILGAIERARNRRLDMQNYIKQMNMQNNKQNDVKQIDDDTFPTPEKIANLFK